MLMSSVRLAALGLPLLFSLAAGNAAAQAPPAPKVSPPAPSAPAPLPAALPPTQNLTVMVVDVQALLQNSKAAKMVRSQIEEKRTEYTKEISRDEEALRAERDALQRQQATLSPATLNKKGREFQEKVNALDRNVQSKRQALEKSNNDAFAMIQQEMLKIIEDIAKGRKANLVFQRSDLVVFDQKFDVTDEVMQKLDEQMPVLNVNFVIPVMPSASAAPSTAPVAKAKRK